MYKKLFLLILILIILPLGVSAQTIPNPELVNSMRVEILQRGIIEITGSVNEVEFNVSIPQEDMFQKIESIEVSTEYNFVYDSYGNRLLKIVWKNPTDDINFQIKTILSLKRKVGGERQTKTDFVMPTELVESVDKTITDLASNFNGDDFEKIASITKWVNENIIYNSKYFDVSKTATQTLQSKEGVCDEITNLLVSLTRNLGYYSGVVAGWAYGKGRFEPHSWAEIYTEKGVIQNDPTWAELGFVDATHIKFAILSDTTYIQERANAKGTGDFKIDLKPMTTEIKILDYKQEPILTAKSELLDKSVWSGYAVIRTKLETDGCILTKMKSQACVSDANDFLETINPEKIVYFCDNKYFFSIFKIPSGLNPMTQYQCPLAVIPYAGERQDVTLSISLEEPSYTKINIDKSVLTPGEIFTVESEGSHIFTDYGDYAFEHAVFKSPWNDFKVYAYRDGSLVEEKISVIKVKPLDIQLQVNDTALVGKSIQITLNIKNLLEKSQSVTVRFLNQTQTKTISESEKFDFSFTPKNINDNLIQIFVSTDTFSTSVSKVIVVNEKKSWHKILIEKIISFFGKIFRKFK